MEDKMSQAVSFANNYFALVDGLASELESYLADDVVLDWFGQTISGRENVAAFMKYHKLTSRHVFTDISPTDSIGYRRTPPIRRKFNSFGGPNENDNMIINDESEVQYKRKCFSDGFNQNINKSGEFDDSVEVVESEMDLDAEELNKTGVNDSFIKKELDLEKLKLDNFSTPQQTFNLKSDFNDVGYVLENIAMSSQVTAQIKPTNFDDIERCIAHLKLQEKECSNSQIEGNSSMDKIESLNFIEASGIIEFSRYYHTKQIRKDVRRRNCKLQIAYSVQDKSSVNVKSELKNKEPIKGYENFVNQNNMFEERNEFLNCLQLQMSKGDESISNLTTPKYVNGRLKFDKNFDNTKTFGGDASEFIFNYNIHVIIYGSNTKCRLNLSHEFETKDFLEDE